MSTNLSAEYYNGMLKAMNPKKTMTLNLTEREMDALEKICEHKGMSKTAVMRQALRIYQLVEERAWQGDRMFFKDKDGKEVIEMIFSGGCGWEGMD